jgi:hypothetical protein
LNNEKFGLNPAKTVPRSKPLSEVIKI